MHRLYIVSGCVCGVEDWASLLSQGFFFFLMAKRLHSMGFMSQ